MTAESHTGNCGEIMWLLKCCVQVVLIQLETGALLCKPKGPLWPEQEQKDFHGSNGFFLLSCFTLKQKGGVARVTWTEGTFFKKQRAQGRFELKSASPLFCHSEERQTKPFDYFFAFAIEIPLDTHRVLETFTGVAPFDSSLKLVCPVPGESRRWQPDVPGCAGKAASSALVVALPTSKLILFLLGRKRFCYLLIKAITEGLRSKELVWASYCAPGQQNVFCY